MTDETKPAPTDGAGLPTDRAAMDEAEIAAHMADTDSPPDKDKIVAPARCADFIGQRNQAVDGCQKIVIEDPRTGRPTYCNKPVRRGSYCDEHRKIVFFTRPHRGTAWTRPRNEAA